MTYQEFYDDVCRLGYESDLQDADAFLTVARRSQRQLFVDIRQSAAVALPQGTHTVDLLHIAADLLFFVEVRRADGTVENGATVCADILTLPTACDSTYTLYYHRAPRPLSDADTTEADIPRGCEHLLALLTASYLYLDDEPERAQYYLSLYRDGMLRLTQTATHSHALPYRDVIGW